MYSIMHRSQLNLEDWQYDALRARGEREGRSLSDLVREAVAEYLVGEPKAPGPAPRLRSLAGIGDDPEASGREHDRFLHRSGRRRS
jgi:plasmid stability protein